MDEREQLIGEKYSMLREQRQYYDKLHYLRLLFLDPDNYYEGLKDYSTFKEPKNNSHKDAEKEVGISIFLKFKALFLDKAKCDLIHKKEKAKILEKEYEKYHYNQVKRLREEFYDKQQQYNSDVELKKENLKNGKANEVCEYFKEALLRDKFSLDILETNELYPINVIIDGYSNESKVLSYHYRIPDHEQICVIGKFLFDENEETIVSKDIDAEHARIIRLKVARALILRSAVLIFGSDNYKNIESVNITGYLEYYDTAFGNWEYIDVMKVNISRECYNKINPERANLKDLFERKLKVKESTGLYIKRPYELKHV